MKNENRELHQTAAPAIMDADFYLSLINRFAISLLGKSTLDDIFWLIAHNTMEDLGFEDCVIYLMAESGTHLNQKAAYGPKNPAGKLVKDPIIIPIGEGIVGSVAASKNLEIIPDTRLDDRYIIDDSYRLSELAIPIVYEDRCIGVIDSEHSQVNFYTSDHVKILTTIANMAAAKIADAMKAETLLKTVAQLQLSQSQLLEQAEELISARNAEQAANKAKSQFLSTMSHEIRTPMNSIIGMTDLLALDKELNPLQLKQIDIIGKASASLLRLITQILDLSRMEAQEVDLDVGPVHLQSLIKEVTNFANQSGAQGRQPPVTHLASTIPETVTLDGVKLKQILAALLANAYKFSDRGNVDLSVDLDQSGKNQQLVLSITDKGIGIDNKYLSTIFNPFTQVDGSFTRRYAGTGLGLAITQRLCLLMNGEISVNSELGKGTTFTVVLPFQ